MIAPFTMVEFELVGIAGDFDAVPVRVEKTD
jgi:hypothetical protein